MKEIRIGLVGSGWMGKAHSSALADAEMLFGPDYGTASFEIVADANEEAAKSAQKKIGFKRISTDWNDVVTDPNVDLVDIATPNAFHYVVAKAALENGIPVVLGNDVGCPWITQYDFWRELYYFQKYVGVSNSFALYTATGRSAELAGIGDITGTITPGKSSLVGY